MSEEERTSMQYLITEVLILAAWIEENDPDRVMAGEISEVAYPKVAKAQALLDKAKQMECVS